MGRGSCPSDSSGPAPGFAQLELALPTGSAIQPYLLADGVLLDEAGSGTTRIAGLNNTTAGLLGAGLRCGDSANLNYIGVAAGGGYNRQLNVHINGLALVANGAAALELAGYSITLNGEWPLVQPSAPFQPEHRFAVQGNAPV